MRTIAAALFLAIAVAVSLCAAAEQVQIMRYARQSPMPVNAGLPDIRRGFTFCRLRYERTRRQRKTGWWDDYPASDFNFLSRLEELTTVSISRWKNGDPGFAQVTLQDKGALGWEYTADQSATPPPLPKH